MDLKKERVGMFSTTLKGLFVGHRRCSRVQSGEAGRVRPPVPCSHQLTEQRNQTQTSPSAEAMVHLSSKSVSLALTSPLKKIKDAFGKIRINRSSAPFVYY